jgi:hypothetical protein
MDVKISDLIENLNVSAVLCGVLKFDENLSFWLWSFVCTAGLKNAPIDALIGCLSDYACRNKRELLVYIFHGFNLVTTTSVV